MALIRAHGHPDGGDHRNVGHLADAVELLLEGAQSARAGGARELPSLSRGLLVQLDHAIGAVEQEVAEHRLEEVTVEGDAGQGGLAVTEVLDHRGGLVEGASDERGVVAVDGIEVLAVEDAKHLRVLGEGPEIGDEPLLVHLWRAEGGVGERDGVRSGHAILKKRASERSERDARGEAKSCARTVEVQIMELMLVGCRHVEDEDARRSSLALTEVPRGEVSKATASSWRFREEKLSATLNSSSAGPARIRLPRATRAARASRRAEIPTRASVLPRASGHSTVEEKAFARPAVSESTAARTLPLISASRRRPHGVSGGARRTNRNRMSALRDTLLGDAVDVEDCVT